MKKIISTVLAMILVLSCVPFAFAADTYTPADGEALTGTSDGKETVRILAGRTVSIADSYEIRTNTNLIVDADATLRIPADAQLIVNGTMLISANGLVHNEGDFIVNSAISNAGIVENAVKGAIQNKENITGKDSVIKNEVYIPDTNEGLMYHVRVCRPDFYAVGSEGGLYRKDANGEATALNESAFGGKDTGVRTYLVDGQSIYFYLEYSMDGEALPAIDPAKFVVNANGTRVNYDRGLYKVTPDNQAVTVSYESRLDAANMYKFYKTIPIYLPAGEGYRVVAYGTTLDQAANEEIDKIVVNYGSDFYFRVEVFDGWQQSNITVTVGGLEVQPDKFGYYEISNITDAGAEDGAYEIYVAGVVKDSTQNLIASIMNTIRNIMETIIDVFRTLFSTLGIDLTKTTAPATEPAVEPVVNP